MIKKSYQLKGIIHIFAVLEILGKHIGLVVLILVGFYLTPSIGYACEKKNGSIARGGGLFPRTAGLAGAPICYS